MKSSALTMSIVCWTGRLLALGLFLFWGAFFVEHLKQWFLHPVNGFPPGLGVAWTTGAPGNPDRADGSLALAGYRQHSHHPRGLSFFGGLAVSEAIAGKRYHLFFAFLAVTIIPALLTLAYWFARTRAMINAKTPLA